MLENIIFDLGRRSLEYRHGPNQNSLCPARLEREDWKGINQSGHLIFENLEIGLDSPAKFRKKIRQILPSSPTDAEIDYAWNAMLRDFPIEIVNYLVKLKANTGFFC